MQRLTNTCSVIQQRPILFLYSSSIQDQILIVLRLSSFGSGQLSAIYLAFFQHIVEYCNKYGNFATKKKRLGDTETEVAAQNSAIKEPLFCLKLALLLKRNKEELYIYCYTEQTLYTISFSIVRVAHQLVCQQIQSPFLFVEMLNYAPSILFHELSGPPYTQFFNFQIHSDVMDGYANPPAPSVGCGVPTSQRDDP